MFPAEGKGSAIHDGVSRGRVYCLKNRLFPIAATITNAGMVNAHDACSNHADFCIFFATSGRFLLFKNPFKYKRIFEINQRKAWVERAHGASSQNMTAISMR
jgi:hypothetical protein